MFENNYDDFKRLIQASYHPFKVIQRKLQLHNSLGWLSDEETLELAILLGGSPQDQEDIPSEALPETPPTLEPETPIAPTEEITV